MNNKIQDFWSSYWNRDSSQDQTDDEQWKDSINIIDTAIQQQPEIVIPVADLNAWRIAIRKTKTKTAKQPKDLVVSQKPSLIAYQTLHYKILLTFSEICRIGWPTIL